MDSETGLKILAKIEALELLATFTLAAVYDLKGYSSSQVDQLRSTLRTHAEGMTVSNIDPVESDHYCAERSDAIDRLLKVACYLRGSF